MNAKDSYLIRQVSWTIFVQFKSPLVFAVECFLRSAGSVVEINQWEAHISAQSLPIDHRQTCSSSQDRPALYFQVNHTDSNAK